MTPVINRVPIAYGLTWFGQGWRGFANAPGLLIGVMFLWAVVAIGLGLIPLLGSLMFTLVSPALFGGYLLMCRAAIDDSGPSLEQFFTGLTQRECRGDAIALGLLLLAGHILALLIATAAFFLFCLALFGGIPWDTVAELNDGVPALPTLDIGMLLVLLLTALVTLVPYTLIAMAFTYGAPLVLDNRATAFTALVLSFKACVTNILPLSVFAILYLALVIIAMIPLALGLLIFIPVSMAALAASYADIFG